MNNSQGDSASNSVRGIIHIVRHDATFKAERRLSVWIGAAQGSASSRRRWIRCVLRRYRYQYTFVGLVPARGINIVVQTTPKLPVPCWSFILCRSDISLSKRLSLTN
uniref:Uncharacterized protein n=1 Tax=Spongospora subterranea TaxID=70186 RepID=A0A0H5RDS9_9EUKA|eukprot:CRZ12400.1 hypothetical protein [Spongospora subterranea]